MLKRLPPYPRISTPGVASLEVCAFVKWERTMSLMSYYRGGPLQGEAEIECVRAEVTLCWEQGSTQTVWGVGKGHSRNRP